jgi:hypothetical protein
MQCRGLTGVANLAMWSWQFGAATWQSGQVESQYHTNLVGSWKFGEQYQKHGHFLRKNLGINSGSFYMYPEF